MARVFSQKYFLTFVGNVGIYSVGTESVYQIIRSGRTECFAGVSQEGLTHEILTKHSCLHLYWLFVLQSCARHMLYFVRCLVASYPQEIFWLQLHESSHSLSLSLSLSITQPLQLNPTTNTGYKRLNLIIIKFGTE